jgi:hypothetical protein
MAVVLPFLGFAKIEGDPLLMGERGMPFGWGGAFIARREDGMRRSGDADLLFILNGSLGVTRPGDIDRSRLILNKGIFEIGRVPRGWLRGEGVGDLLVALLPGIRGSDRSRFTLSKGILEVGGISAP